MRILRIRILHIQSACTGFASSYNQPYATSGPVAAKTQTQIERTEIESGVVSGVCYILYVYML